MQRILRGGALGVVVALGAGGAPAWAQTSDGASSASDPYWNDDTSQSAAASSAESAPARTSTAEAAEAAATDGAAGPGPVGQAGSPGASDEPAGSSEAGPTYGTRRPLVLTASTILEDPKAYTVSFAGGSQWFDYGDVAEQFEPFTPSFRFQVGRQFFSQVQLQLEVDVIIDTANNLGVETQETSEDTTTLVVAPGILGLSYRFDYFHEQPIVPYIGGGVELAYVSFTTEYASGGNDEEVLGHRAGAYVGGGLEFLLDVFEPSRAADLELSSGINDTYLILDARYHWLQWYFEDFDLKEDDTVRLNGFQFTAGLKFDF